jgi:hypothetical protein
LQGGFFVHKNKTPEEIVQQQLLCYNSQDLAGFVSTYAEDVLIMEHPSGNVLVSGKKALTERYAKMFQENPNNHCVIKDRICYSNYVIDREEITGRDNRGAFEALAIYEVNDQVISKVWFLEAK